MFNRKPAEPEKIDENLGDLECEEAIMSDKTRFGRVRTSLMRHLRTKYGKDVANRALWRVNRRRTEGYLNSNGR